MNACYVTCVDIVVGYVNQQQFTPLNDTDGTMGAKAGETCSFCGTRMVTGASVCRNCNARREEGVKAKHILSALMSGIGIGWLGGALIFLSVATIFDLKQGENPFMVLLLFSLAVMFATPVSLISRSIRKNRGNVRYVRKNEV